MAHQETQPPPPLPESFLRGLEADLRALCTDSRRKNPHAKDAAERVILALKQADTSELKLQGADSAAAAFCAACESPPSSSSSSSSSSSLSSYVKVVLRAVSSLHKLLTHRAVSSKRLPEVLDALHRLALSPVEDTITLKVLQGLLSLLTVRAYAKSLSEDDLSRAFSLLFVLRTVQSSGGNPASKAISSAISQMSSSSSSHTQRNQGIPHQELGVIEQTSKAAFRQASSDLFASAADAAVQTAVRLQVPSGEFIPLDDFPTEARSSYRFFMDLCNAVLGERLSWLTHLSSQPKEPASPSSLPLGLDLSLALEVIDDGLSSSVGLFAAQPVFLDILSKKLCPVIHKLFSSSSLNDKGALKALFALVVTVVTHYWRNLPSESQDLLHSLVNICKPHLPKNTNPTTEATTGSVPGAGSIISWYAVYSMEAMRCIMRAQATDPIGLIDFVQEFELSDWSTKPVSAVINVASDAMDNALFSLSTAKQTNSKNALQLHIAPITGSLKPFAKIIVNTSAFLAATATGLYVHVITGAKLASKYKPEEDDGTNKKVAQALLDKEETRKAIDFIGKSLEQHPFVDMPSTMNTSSRFVSGGGSGIMDVTDLLSAAIAGLCTTADECGMVDIRSKTFSTLANVCSATARGSGSSGAAEGIALGVHRVLDGGERFEKRVSSLYGALFDVVDRCRKSLGRSWGTAVEAFDVLDSLIVYQMGQQQLQQKKQQSQQALSVSSNSSALEKKGHPGAEPGGKAILMSNAIVQMLKERLDKTFETTDVLPWDACHDMISALVQCSRQSMANLSKRRASLTSEDTNLKSTSTVDGAEPINSTKNIRVFGISAAEKAILSALKRNEKKENEEERTEDIKDSVSAVNDPMPSTLWELLAGHLTSVCADSNIYSLRMYSLNSLTTIASEAIAAGEDGNGMVTVAHEKIITPFLDVFNSSHSDVRSGSLSSIYTILETQGERVRGEPAWRVVLSILTTAAGSKANAKVKEGTNLILKKNKPTNGAGGVEEIKMISEGFKVVQVIADDFLSSLARNSLPSWLDVLGLYCRQEDDINVALTSIGLLWRTADFLAKKAVNQEVENEEDIGVELKMEDWLWIEVFTILKEVSTDERPEIRNCAVKTLTGALTAHSVRLSARAWSGCVGRALLPLLEDVMKGGISTSATTPSMPPSAAHYTNNATISNETSGMDNEILNMGVAGIAVIDEEPTGVKMAPASVRPTSSAGAGTSASGRNDGQVMWHHSRDTPRKQWNETRVLALGGVAKVLRSAMPQLSALQDESGRPLFLTLTDGGANGLWRKMLRAAGVAAASRDGEVAIAGVSALLEMLAAAGLVVIPNETTKIQPVEEKGLQPSPSVNNDLATDANSTGAIGVVASMSWIIGGGTPNEEESKALNGANITELKTTAHTEKVEKATIGTVMLWEAVWSALVEAICGSDIENTGSVEKGTSSSISPLRIVNDKALQMLVEGLIESRRKLADKFTRGSSNMLILVLLYLARSGADNKHRVLSRVQDITLDGLKGLSLGGDEESWVRLVRGLLKVVPQSGTFQNPKNVIVCRRVLAIVKSGYEGGEMGESVKREILEEIIEVMGKISMGRGMKLAVGRKDVSNRSSGDTMVQSKEMINEDGNERTLWRDGCDVLITAMRYGTASKGVDMTKEWSKFAEVMERFLFSERGLNVKESDEQSTGSFNDKGTISSMERKEMEKRQRQLYDMKVIACVSEGVQRIGRTTENSNALGSEAKRKLVRIIWRGAEEGERGGRRKFVRMCQMTLFSLAGKKSEIQDDQIAEECGRRVVDMCSRVLSRYIADGVRNGRCPLPLERRAEAVFLLRQLRAMAVNVDGSESLGNDVGRQRVVALYPRLCECVESKDEAVRILARELLDDTSSSNSAPTTIPHLLSV